MPIPSNHTERHQAIADEKVPRHVKSLVHYMHSLTEIYEYYRGFGAPMPKPLQAEMKRAETELTLALESETQQGGILHNYYKELG